MAESKWPELLQLLFHLQYGKVINVAKAMELDDNIKTQLVRKDPVTCARYFDYKVKKMMEYLCSKDGVFGEFFVIDYYIRVEFQLRGSPHVHIISWCNNAPTFAEDSSNDQVLIDFIDHFISCKYDSANPYIAFQTHRHSHSCRKNKKTECRFHFPFPVMPSTMILRPLDSDEEHKRKDGLGNWEGIKELMAELYKNPIEMTFEEVLKKLQIDEDEYIFAIRCQLRRPDVYLKRSSLAVGINFYNSTILVLWEANMDLKPVLNEYGLANYIVNYISKPEAGLAKVLREAAQDENVNSLWQKFRNISNKFLNCSLMSAQEAVYYNLSMSLSKSSRKVVYIDTQPSDQRVRMLKGLKQIEADDTELFLQNVFEKYSVRDNRMKNVCLADFFAIYTAGAAKPKNNSVPTDDHNIDEESEDEEVGNENKDQQNLRKKPRVICSYRYNQQKDPANYYREQCLLYMPWQSELEDIEKQDV